MPLTNPLSNIQVRWSILKEWPGYDEVNRPTQKNGIFTSAMVRSR
jgi:hypothetical protein